MTEYITDQAVLLSAMDPDIEHTTVNPNHTTDTTTTTHSDGVNVVDGNDDSDDNVNEQSNNKTINKDLNDKNNDDVSVEGDELVLTTIDNPHNPKTDYPLWKRWDNDNGHNTEEYIARLISMEAEYDVDDEFLLNVLTNRVIEDILLNDTLEVYRLV